MPDARSACGFVLLATTAAVAIAMVLQLTAVLFPAYLLPVLATSAAAQPASSSPKVDLSWHAPKSTWITDLNSVINGTGVHGFIFNSSTLPKGTKYGTYNWCNMPHVRRQEYPVADRKYELEYVEVVGSLQQLQTEYSGS